MAHGSCLIFTSSADKERWTETVLEISSLCADDGLRLQYMRPVVGNATFVMFERQEIAGTVNSPTLLKAALGRRGSSVDGQLTGEAVDSQSRP